MIPKWCENNKKLEKRHTKIGSGKEMEKSMKSNTKRLNLGSLLPPFGLLWVAFWSLWVAFWSPLVAFRPPLVAKSDPKVRK